MMNKTSDLLQAGTTDQQFYNSQLEKSKTKDKSEI